MCSRSAPPLRWARTKRRRHFGCRARWRGSLSILVTQPAAGTKRVRGLSDDVNWESQSPIRTPAS